MGTKHFWSPQIPQNLRIYVDDLICRDLRTIGGTSLDHKFLVGGPKSIHTTGNPGVTVKLGTLSEKKTRKSGKTPNLIEENLQAYQYRIGIQNLPQECTTKTK